MKLETIRKWWIFVLLWGVAIWAIALGIYLLSPSNLLDTIELLFLFGVSVTTPLAMRVAMQANRQNDLPRIAVIATLLYPVSILAVAMSLLNDTVWLGIGLASVWQTQTLLLFLYGLWRLLQRPIIAIEELCIDFGLLYVPISGVWFLAYSANYSLLTFDSVSVLLTAIHFTFISPGALIIIGMIGRQQYTNKLYRIGASLAIVSPMLVAIGITLTQFSARLWLEAGSVIVLATSFLLLSILCVFGGLPKKIISRILVILSATALFITMTFAIAYSSGRFSGQWAISLDTMVQWHGWLNAMGFTFLALLAWNIEIPVSNVSVAGIPFSTLPWRYRIGASYFEMIDAIDFDKVSPTGIVDDLSVYQQTGFNADDVHSDVRAFYEHTDSHTLLVYPDWQQGFQRLGHIYKQLSRRIGQMNFPIEADSDETFIHSAIIALRDEVDGRESVRGWVRTYPQTGNVVYVAAYSSHVYEYDRYMNIAFPLLFGNLTSILRLETPDGYDGGLRLTSISQRGEDQGVYFANRLCPIRLPINETIRVYPASQLYEGYPDNFEVGTSVAEHKMWLFGIHFLTLHYSIKLSR